MPSSEHVGENKIKNTSAGILYGKLWSCASARASCFIVSSGLSLGLSRRVHFFFLIRPVPPLLPFNAWQVLAGALHGTSIVLNG